LDTLGTKYRLLVKDQLIIKIVNFLLRFTSKWYQGMLEGSIYYGINSAIRDELEGREPPKDYRATIKSQEVNHDTKKG
jgi:hypothetical protein